MDGNTLLFYSHAELFLRKSPRVKSLGSIPNNPNSHIHYRTMFPTTIQCVAEKLTKTLVGREIPSWSNQGLFSTIAQGNVPTFSMR